MIFNLTQWAFIMIHACIKASITQVGQMKEKYEHQNFLKHLPAEFRAFLNHLNSLAYTDTPHYSALQGLLQQCMHRKGWQSCGRFCHFDRIVWVITIDLLVYSKILFKIRSSSKGKLFKSVSRSGITCFWVAYKGNILSTCPPIYGVQVFHFFIMSICRLVVVYGMLVNSAFNEATMRGIAVEVVQWGVLGIRLSTQDWNFL